MHRWLVWSALALSLAGAMGSPVALVAASTVAGNAITISGLDDLNATATKEARTGSGKTFAMLIGMGGLATVLAGRVGLGLGGVGAGLGMGFIPGAISTAFDAAPAAVLEPGPVVSALAGHWWTPALAGCYPVLLAWRVIQDPVLLACLVLLLAVRSLRRPQGAWKAA